MSTARLADSLRQEQPYINTTVTDLFTILGPGSLKTSLPHTVSVQIV